MTSNEISNPSWGPYSAAQTHSCLYKATTWLCFSSLRSAAPVFRWLPRPCIGHICDRLERGGGVTFLLPPLIREQPWIGPSWIGLIMEYIVDDNNVRFLGFQFDLVRQTRTISVYVNDLCKWHSQGILPASGKRSFQTYGVLLDLVEI